MSGHYPFCERYLAALQDGADSHAKGLATVLAFVDTGARAFALEFGNSIILGVTARAYRTVRPQEAFKVCASLVVVVIDRACKIDFEFCHGLVL